MIGKIREHYRENGFLVTSQHFLDSIKRKLYNRMISSSLGGAQNSNIHPSAFIRGLRRITLGANFYAGRDLWLEAVVTHGGRKFQPRIVIGNNVAVNDYVHIAATNRIEIGNNVLMASKIYISDHNHGTYSGNVQSSPDVPPNERLVTNDMQVVIEDNVWIGEFVSILAGATIGKGSIIGANSVVTGTIPPYSIAVGTPARAIKRYDFASCSWVTI
jgi:acetyltransferase-like isoleucine patch superfamily enzyme